MVRNGILMETIGISVMVSIGLLLLLFFSRVNLTQLHLKNKHLFCQTMLNNIACIFPRCATRKSC